MYNVEGGVAVSVSPVFYSVSPVLYVLPLPWFYCINHGFTKVQAFFGHVLIPYCACLQFMCTSGRHTNPIIAQTGGEIGVQLICSSIFIC